MALWRVFSIVFLLAGPAGAVANGHRPPPLRPATDFAAVDVHASEQVAVAADPCDTSGKCAYLGLDYRKYGFLPVRVIITNNSGAPVSLAEARIDFFTAQGNKVLAATPEEVERRTDTIANPASLGTVLPAPLPRIHGHSHNRDKQVLRDFDAYGFHTLTVGAHTTVDGHLFYDVAGTRNPLAGAWLEVRELRDASGKDLSPFEVFFGGLRQGKAH